MSPTLFASPIYPIIEQPSFSHSYKITKSYLSDTRDVYVDQAKIPQQDLRAGIRDAFRTGYRRLADPAIAFTVTKRRLLGTYRAFVKVSDALMHYNILGSPTEVACG